MKGRVYIQYLGRDGEYHVFYRTISSIEDITPFLKQFEEMIISVWIVRMTTGLIGGGGNTTHRSSKK